MQENNREKNNMLQFILRTTNLFRKDIRPTMYKLTKNAVSKIKIMKFCSIGFSEFFYSLNFVLHTFIYYFMRTKVAI